MLVDAGLITVKGASYYKAVVGWTLWPGAAILVGAGPHVVRHRLAEPRVARSKGSARSSPASDARRRASPPSKARTGGFRPALAVLSPIVILLMVTLFDIPVWAALLAVPLGVIMGFIAARVTGETDVTPTKALGPVTQMIYGAVTPGNMTGNIMSANVTGGIGLHAADLLTTLKTGWLLGAKPRHQLYAQLFGVLAGAAIVVPAFMLIIPHPTPEQAAAGITTVLGTEQWPAPSCLVWAGVSEAFSNGIGDCMHSTKIAIVVGLVIGIGLTVIEKFAPKGAKPFIPSANGVGIAMVIPGSNCDLDVHRQRGRRDHAPSPAGRHGRAGRFRPHRRREPDGCLDRRALDDRRLELEALAKLTRATARNCRSCKATSVSKRQATYAISWCIVRVVAAPLLELVDIARYYQMGDERIAALDGVSFTVEEGRDGRDRRHVGLRQVDAAQHSRHARYTVVRSLSTRRQGRPRPHR